MVCPIPRSGRLGFVGDYTGDILTRFARIRNWRFSGTAFPRIKRYAGLRFGTQRSPGFIEYRGSFQGFGAYPPLFPGDTFTFFGYTAPTSGIACTPGCVYYTVALVDTLTIQWNWVAEDPTVSWTIGFSSNSDLTTNLAFDDPCDDNVFCDESACNLGLRLFDPCDENAPVEFCNLTRATLTFTSSNISYSNNSTNCLIRREIGNLDFRLEVVDQNPCVIPVLNQDYYIEIDASLTEMWKLKWAQNTGFDDFVVDTEEETMIGKTNIFEKQGVNCCEPVTPVRGQILYPGDIQVWPFLTPS